MIPPLPSSLRFNLDESVDMQVLATQCPANLTGADLYALCSNATLTALRRQIEIMEQQSRHPLVSYVMQPPFQPPLTLTLTIFDHGITARVHVKYCPTVTVYPPPLYYMTD